VQKGKNGTGMKKSSKKTKQAERKAKVARQEELVQLAALVERQPNSLVIGIDLGDMEWAPRLRQLVKTLLTAR
jgi:hypothetical protein